jgi:hypothetical protein
VPSTPQPTEPATTQGGGNINETVPEGTVVSLPAVAIAQTADVGSGVSVAIASIERIQGEARLPGEIAGPALAIKVNVVNGTNEPLSLSAVTVTLEDSAAVPATTLSAPPNAPFSGTVDAGQSAQGVYVFSYPPELVPPVTVTVSYAPAAPVAVFTGDVP